MFGGTGSVKSYIGYVVTVQGMNAVVYVVGLVFVAVEAGYAEIGLHESRLDVGYPYTCVGEVDTQAVTDSFYSRLGGTINIAASISGVACQTTHIDYVSAVALYHVGHNEMSHRKHSLDIGVYHCLPIFRSQLVFFFKSKSEAGIVDQYINITPFTCKRFYSFGGGLAVTYIKCERLYISAVGIQFLL